MCNAHHPVDKLVLVFIETTIDGSHYLIKRVLKNIVCHVFVLDYGENISVNLGFVARKKGFETSIVAFLVAHYQLIIRESADIVGHKKLRLRIIN